MALSDSTKRHTAQVLLVLVVLAAGLGGARFLAAMREPPPQTQPPQIVPLVETLTVERGDVDLAVRAQGTVVPRTASTLVAEVSGAVLEVAEEFRAGGAVDAGELLVRLDDADYRLALAEARSALAQAELRVRQTEADAESARRDWERSGNSSEPDDLVLRVPQLADARAQLALAEARLEKARRDLERCTVRAPFDARVASTGVDRGQFAARGTSLGVLYGREALEVRIPLPDRDLAHLDLPLGGSAGANGPSVRLSTTFAGERHAWSGRVVRTEAELDPASRMVVAVARVDETSSNVHDRTVPLSVGMFVDVELVGRTMADKVSLPREALRAGDRVFVVDDEDRLRFRGVEVLRRGREDAVLGAGLTDGDRVVVSPLEAPVDGMLVEPTEALR